MKTVFLFGVGAEVGYGLPSGEKIALEIFRQDTTRCKGILKQVREKLQR